MFMPVWLTGHLAGIFMELLLGFLDPISVNDDYLREMEGDSDEFSG
jgi:hypothetical protein